MKRIIISLIVGIVIGASGTYFTLPHDGKIDVGKPTVSETHYNKPKTDDCVELKERAESPINITGEYKNGSLGVDAFDSWKSAHADFPISCEPTGYKYTYQISYLVQYHDKKIVQSYGAMIFKHWGPFAAGLGPVLGDDPGGQFAISYSH